MFAVCGFGRKICRVVRRSFGRSNLVLWGTFFFLLERDRIIFRVRDSCVLFDTGHPTSHWAGRTERKILLRIRLTKQNKQKENDKRDRQY